MNAPNLMPFSLANLQTDTEAPSQVARRAHELALPWVHRFLLLAKACHHQREFWLWFLGVTAAWVAHDLIDLVTAGIGHCTTSKLLWILVHPTLFMWGFCGLAPAMWASLQGSNRMRPLVCLCVAWLFFGVIWALEGWLSFVLNGQWEAPAGLRYHLMVFAPLMVAAGALWTQRDAFSQEKRRIEGHLQDAQGTVLLGQLHPHLLFNALNNLAELARKQPERTEEGIVQLSEFVRKVMKACVHRTHSLEEESGILEAFLDLEGSRLGRRLKVEWDWDEGLSFCRIPTLLLQPIVENALKHGIRPHLEGGVIRLVAKRQGDQLVLEVCNTGQGLQGHRSGGIGVQNLIDRLHVVYQDRAAFDLYTEAEWTIARLRLPMHETSFAHVS